MPAYLMICLRDNRSFAVQPVIMSFMYMPAVIGKFKAWESSYAFFFVKSEYRYAGIFHMEQGAHIRERQVGYVP